MNRDELKKVLETMQQKFQTVGTKQVIENVEVEKEIKQVVNVNNRNSFDLTRTQSNIINTIKTNETLPIETKNNVIVKNDIVEVVKIDNTLITETEQTQTNNNVDNISIIINDKLGGVEIKFKNKPSVDVLNQLKNNGFLWSFKKFLWYAKQSESRIKFAYSLINDITNVIETRNIDIIDNVNNEVDNIVKVEKQEPKKEPINILSLANSILDNITFDDNTKQNKVEVSHHLQVENENIFILAKFPSINKNNTIEENNQELERKSYIAKCKITNMIMLDLKNYNIFKNNLLTDYNFLMGKGGSEIEDDRSSHFIGAQVKPKLLYNYVVCVMCEGEKVIVVNPEGHSYARYTGEFIEKLKG